MKLVSPKAELLPWIPGIEGVYKTIELAGRTCYKSEDKITEYSAKDFVDRMVKSNHTAMLEHGTVYLFIPWDEYYDKEANFRYFYNKYSVHKRIKGVGVYITTNYRVIVENGWMNDLQYLCDPMEHHEMRYIMKLVCSRAIANELVRHRVFSFAQESTRYCNYSKDKFGNELTFITPAWLPELSRVSIRTMMEDIEAREAVREEVKMSASWFTSALIDTEKCYFELLKWGSTPQQARDVLPLATKTEICMTGFAKDWKHFFDLRYFGTTGKPHPDMVQLATLMKEEAEKNLIWEDIVGSKADSNE